MKEDWFENGFITGNRPYIWIICLGILVYFWTVFFGFTYFDDKTLILNNLFYLKNLGNILNTFTIEVFHVLHASAAYYRPILTISLMLDAQISGASPFFYHVTNLIIHLATTSLVYVFLSKLNIKRSLAFVFAIIFATHPVSSQAVAWIPGRNDSLLALFVLVALTYLIKAFESGKAKYYLWHLVFFALALFTKESGILTPFFAISLWLLFHKKPSNSILMVFSWSVIIIIWFFLRKMALDNPISYQPLEVAKALYLESPAILLFLGKIFFPFNLSVLPTLQDSTLIYGAIALLLIIVSLLFSRNKKYSVLCFGFIWFLAFLLPSFIRPSSGYVPDFLEHRVYLPIIGVFLVLSEIDFLKNLDFSGRRVFLGTAFLIIILTIINFIHTANFRNQVVFWRSAVKTSPSHPLAHKNLGATLYLTGDLTGAESEYQTSLKLNPVETMVHNNLGLIYFNREEYQKAEEEYQKELAINPLYDNAFFNWGLVDFKLGRVDAAEAKWLRTLEINPDYTDAMKNLFVVYYQKKDQTKADYYYNELLKRGIKLNLNI